MNFGRLLAAGKSLVNGNVAGRYQMRKGMNLPQFISPKNPFAPEEVAEKSASVPSDTSKEVAAPGVTITPPRPRLWPRAAEALRRIAFWCLDHNPFSAIGRPKLPTIPRFGKPPVQSELSLEKVKVVRGDLTHSDLEVVSTGGTGHQMSSAAWRSMATKVFGSGNK